MAYHLTPKPEGEYFQFCALRFDVDKARRIIGRKPREIERQPVADWARAYGTHYLLPNADTDYRAVFLGPDQRTFDRAYAITTDLEIPVIIANHENQLLLIDGCHRLYKHYVGGSETMPSFVLTEAETKAILIK
ncbi:hypothetical protein ACFVGM_09270 [Kitasatospora purpeofusca]|uniref:hypothetical protein n=1 Tax=Kitasatospora purpeofusca TaxID=67352 RepID=UPI0036D110F4